MNGLLHASGEENFGPREKRVSGCIKRKRSQKLRKKRKHLWEKRKMSYNDYLCQLLCFSMFVFTTSFTVYVLFNLFLLYLIIVLIQKMLCGKLERNLTFITYHNAGLIFDVFSFFQPSA